MWGIDPRQQRINAMAERKPHLKRWPNGTWECRCVREPGAPQWVGIGETPLDAYNYATGKAHG
ncbi:hypothetical protein CBM2637_A150025 [Cupriavidus taiwanensis]|nr:hypothetical protein CBM2637_A150025 [Cupriavidus taiwanensis]